ncbi:hypothetical protein O6H91_14G042500 [Diphasiastrum complanatum]|uniref:Uncharacterized protein n=1 Tax=Diphasiastrum complanatum TaxID=34168 RepID=A0ACC2BNS5_DIPCM|nr:hypothetical protein O6H91_14G042500 [Diphasiastrum complanatum]
MDEKLWSNLPDDLVERVLAWLPISSFFRFRTVCKKWRSIMYCRSFLEMNAQVPTREVFFLKVARCKCRMLTAFNPATNNWANIPVSFLPSQVSVPAASSRGLLCFMAAHYVDGYSVLLVCNPLTKWWRALPPMSCRRYPFVVGMAVDARRKSYKVVVAGDYNSYANRRSTEVYDSATGIWKTCGSLPHEEEITKTMVACNAHFFCLSRGPGSGGLLAYSLQQEAWMKVRTGRMPGYSKHRHLVASKGRILIVGKALRHQVLGLYIWALDASTTKWREVGQMPQPIAEQFFRTPSECFYCASHGDFIFVSKFFCDQGLAYHLPYNTWTWVLNCPKIANPFILPFEPSFDAVY